MMYRYRYAVFLLISICLGGFVYAICEFSKVKKAAEDLKQVNMFAVGLVGFVAHLTEGEVLYRQILESRYSKMLLLKIGNSDQSTLEAKMYAACGLYAVSPVDFYILSAKLKGKEDEVSVFRTDILQKESVDELLDEIVSGRCKTW